MNVRNLSHVPMAKPIISPYWLPIEVVSAGLTGNRRTLASPRVAHAKEPPPLLLLEGIP